MTDFDTLHPTDTNDMDDLDPADYGECWWCGHPLTRGGICRCGQPSPGQLALEDDR